MAGGSKKRRRAKRAQKAIRERRDPKPRGVMQMLDFDPGPWGFSLLLIVAFGWVIWANGDLSDGEKTLQWPETTGKIVSTSVSKTTSGGSSGNPGRAGSHTTSGSSTWHVAVSYRYDVDGHAYSGDRIAWSGGWSYSTSSEAHEKVRELEALATIPVFYDRRRPSQAVLVRGGNFGNLFVGVLMIGAAVGLLTFSYLKQRPVQRDVAPEKRRRPVRRAVLSGFAAAVVAGGVQYLVYLRMFT